jgi:RNA polymerase sigma factor (TIGR02999 family)
MIGGPEDLTKQLRDWAEGNATAGDQAVSAVYSELRRLASAALARELHQDTAATSLVHDLFLRLATQKPVDWQDRGHFFGVAARMLRQLLVARARHRNALKRGSGQSFANLEDENCPISVEQSLSPEDLLSLNGALDSLAVVDPQLAQLVELRYFAGLSVEETASALDLSSATVKRHWTFARRWLHRQMTGSTLASPAVPD